MASFIWDNIYSLHRINYIVLLLSTLFLAEDEWCLRLHFVQVFFFVLVALIVSAFSNFFIERLCCWIFLPYNLSACSLVSLICFTAEVLSCAKPVVWANKNNVPGIKNVNSFFIILWYDFLSIGLIKIVKVKNEI